MSDLTWTHPTGRSPKTVVLVCLGPSRNAYLNALFQDDLSEAVMGVDETWTLNRGANLFRHDLLWIMDHIQGEADRFPRYGASLWTHDKPIITSDNHEGWPDHVRAYPLALIGEWLRLTVNPMHGDWFHNSLAYIIVYAAFIGVTELRIFGADYSNHSSGVVEDGHPCVAYWVGKMEAAGLTVKVPADSAFLNANQRHWLYGYRHDPRVIPNNRKRFRDLVGLPAETDALGLLRGERQVSETVAGIQPDHVLRYRWAKERVTGRVYDLGCGVGYGAHLLAQANAVTQVVAMDRSEEALAFAREHYADPKIAYQSADFSCPGRFGFTADCAVAFELIEHLVNPAPLLAQVPARRLLASVPNEDTIPYSPETAPHHHRHYRRHEFNELLNRTGWRVTHWRGQMHREGAVEDFRPDCRTIVVEAERCLPDALSNTPASPGG